jgi:plastocyanin
MRGHAGCRSIVTVAGAVLLMSLVGSPGAALASGGGGCGRAVTDASGTRVSIRDFCFGPTILRAEPGDTVTWRNFDGAPHAVLGANAAWGGFDSIRREIGEVSYRFVRSGVYPYVCTYHPGMIGAVVVGDAAARGAADTVTTADGPVTLVPSPVVEAATLRRDVVRSDAPLPTWAAFGWGIGVTVVVASGLGLARRRNAAMR